MRLVPPPQRAAGALLLVLACAATAIGCAGPQRKDLPVVRNLRIEGATQVAPGDIQGRILTTETSKWTGWLPEWVPFADRQYFEPNTWTTDLRRIERYYRAEGFYEARVIDDDETFRNDGDDVDLRVQVKEGPPMQVAELDIVGLDELPPDHRARALHELPLAPGKRFREADWDALKESLRTRLRHLGYAEATIEGEARVDIGTDNATLVVRVMPGPRYRFGDLHVSTQRDAQVKPNRVADEARPAVKPGTWFSDEALTDAQARVFRMGVFGAVKANAAAPDPATGTVPVVIDVREAPFHTLRAGGGFGSDPVRQELRGLVEYTHRNFLGGLRRLTLGARAGWAFIPSLIAVAGDNAALNPQSAPFFSLRAELEQPRLIWGDVRGLLTTEVSSNIQQAYQFLGGRIRPELVWQPHADVAVRGSVNIEGYRLWGQTTLLDVRTPTEAAAAALTYGCDVNPCNVLLTYLEQAVEWDRRDDRLEPHKGYYLSLSLQEGSSLVSGAPPLHLFFLRVIPDARYYQPLGDRFTLAGRLRIGTLIPLNNVPTPIVARFFSGGANSMRGFGTNRLSPLQAVAESIPDLISPIGRIPGYTYGDLSGVTVPIGGNGLFESSLELRWLATKALVVALFADAGLVTQRSFAGWAPAHTLGSQPPPPRPYFQNMQYAVGLGLRYRTPIGPVRLDFAYRLPIGPPLDVVQLSGATVAYPTQGTCFGIGDRGQTRAGSPEGPCVIHVSIGEAF